MTAVAFAPAKLEIADLESCWSLDQVCFADGERYDRETFRALIAHPDGVCLKASAPGINLAGFVIGMVEVDQTGHVVVLGVAPSMRRRGVGRALMAELERELIARGVHLVHLEVRTTNTGAQTLYDGLGYAIAGRRLAYYTNGDDGFLMVKALKEPE